MAYKGGFRGGGEGSEAPGPHFPGIFFSFVNVYRMVVRALLNYIFF